MSTEISTFSIDRTNVGHMQNNPYAMLLSSGSALLLGYNWAYETLFQNINEEASVTSFDPEILAFVYNELSDDAAARLVRVRKNNNGYSIYTPAKIGFAQLLDVFPDFRNRSPKEMEDALLKIFPTLLQNTPLDESFSGAELLAGFEDGIEPELIDHETAEIVVEAISGFRVVAPPVKLTADQTQMLETGDFRLGEYVWRSTLMEMFDNRSFKMFAEIKLSQKAAEFLTQRRGDSILMQQLGEAFSRMHQHLYPRGKQKSAFVPNVVAVSDIAKDNKTSEVIITPGINADGLSLERNGDLLWLPLKSPDPEFVEEALEEGGKQADGDWTAYDAVNPEETEYTREDGIKRRKDKGQNRLMYLDWIIGKLSFTDDNARVRIHDIAANRPARASHLLKLLETDITKKSDSASQIVAALNFGITISKKYGMPPQFSYEEYGDTLVSRGEFEHIARTFADGGPGNAIVFLYNQLVYAHNELEGAEQQELTPEQYQAIEATTKYGVTIRQVSPNSPIGLFRGMYDWYAKLTEAVVKDPDRAFGTLAVLSTLRMIGILVLLTKYVPKYTELQQLDKQERKPYLDPDLDPPGQVEFPEIPFVSGKVELMPHQVKALNYLKNFPKKAVLNVDAGGGKTLLALVYASMLIGAGKAKKCLFCCPGNLISNYYNDAGWIFAGRVNLINISTTVMQSKHWGPEKIKSMVEAAPPNTLFISDYDFLAPSSKSKSMSKFIYGNTQVVISENTQFMRSIKWDLIVYDEVHLLKTYNGNRNVEMTKLAASVPYLLEMSGTYVSDNLTDVVGTFGIIDPQTFGTKEQFIENFLGGEEKATNLNGARQQRLRAEMAKEAQVITITRKEWAALLPKRYDAFYKVDLTPAQRLVYQAILTETKEEIAQALKNNPLLAASFKSKKKASTNVEGEQEENDDEENVDDLLDGPLNMYLQRLEKFVTAPTADPLGIHLTGKDALSPKLAKVVELIEQHFASKVKGKIMVWTQYIDSAATVFEQLPDNLRAKAIHYTSATSAMVISRFQTDPRIQILVGCEKSINTGHNLQVASRLIRLENVWNYGSLEQGESRINRPASNDSRKEENGGNGIHFDWVFCNYSIDVTKMSRLFGKLISTVKFYQSNNPDYMAIEEHEPPKMNLENLFSMNDWQGEEGCRKYFESYEQYQQVQEKDYEAFRNDPKNVMDGYALANGKMLKGSGLLVNVPYVPRMQIYNADQLGLEPFMEYVVEHKNKKGISLWDDPNWSPAELNIHCEYGDCVAVDYNRPRGRFVFEDGPDGDNGDEDDDDAPVGKLVKKYSNTKPVTMRVIAPDGSTVSVPLTAAWVITRTMSKGSDIRKAFAQMVGADTGNPVVPKVLRVNPLGQPAQPEHQQEEQQQQEQQQDQKNVNVRDVGRGVPNARRGRLEEKDPKGAKGFEVFVSSYTNIPALVVDSKNAVVKKNMEKLEEMGFEIIPPYYYALIKNPKVLRSWMTAAEKAGLEISPEYEAALNKDIKALLTHTDPMKLLEGLTRGKRPNFFKLQAKAIPGVIKPYIFIDNKSSVFLCVNQKPNAAELSTILHLNVKGVTWSPIIRGEMAAFFQTKREMETTLKEMLVEFPIENKKEALQDFMRIRVVKQTKVNK